MSEDILANKIFDIMELEQGHDVTNLSRIIAGIAIEHFRTIHSKALACHCECLGMNAENALAVCGNYTPPYNNTAYFKVMEKWGLVDEKGKSII